MTWGYDAVDLAWFDGAPAAPAPVDYDQYPTYRMREARVDNATAIISAPGAGFRVMVFSYSTSDLGVDIQETGASPQTFAPVPPEDGVGVFPFVPIGWFVTRDNRGLQAASAITGRFRYKVVPS